jgi:antitoxin VapB
MKFLVDAQLPPALARWLTAKGHAAEHTDRLTREIAALTGETLTDTIRIALSERLERERLRRAQPLDPASRFRAIGELCASLPDLDTRDPDDILGYDEHGLWT